MVSLRLDRISVSFPIYSRPNRSIRRRVVAATTGGRIGSDKHHAVVVKALEDVSLDLTHGDRVGLVGRNGAGKSTLLRVMAGIYEPTAGAVFRVGRVAPLFDPNLGFDRENTGYENIFNRGLYLGLRPDVIRAKIDEIAEFTELGDYLGMAIHTYSAGMRARLAFAVSAAIEPEILLLDEGFGAGDATFMKKAHARMKELVERSGILVLASHSEGLLRSMCTKGLLLDRGKVMGFGPLDEILQRYDIEESAAPVPGIGEERVRRGA